MLSLSQSINCLLHESARFDPWSLTWVPYAEAVQDRRDISPLEALAWLYAQPRARRLTIAVIGPREANAQESGTAETLGRRLGELGVPMVTGGPHVPMIRFGSHWLKSANSFRQTNV
jgi:hypothetical protein